MTTKKKVLIGILTPITLFVTVGILVEVLGPEPPPVEVTKECITHEILSLHIHPYLTIIRNGIPDERIPGGIGIISDDCLRPIHTHEVTPKKLHIEYPFRNYEFTLGQFFEVWGIPLDDGTKEMTVTVDGELVSDPENLVLRDKQEIIIRYE